MKPLFICCGIVMLWSMCKAGGVQEKTLYLSLIQACKMGIKNDVTIQNTKLEQQKTQYQCKEAAGRLYPHFEGYSTFNFYYAIPKTLIPGEVFGRTGMIPVEFGTKYDWSSGFKATQVLYNQLAFMAVRLANRLSELGSLSLQQKKEEVIYRISQVYYLCLATSSQIELLQLSLDNMDQLLDITRLQNENGVIRKIDYSRTLVNKLNLQTQIDNLTRLFQEQTGMLKYCIGVDTNASIVLTDSLTSGIDSLPSDHPGFDQRIELRLIDQQIGVAALNLKMRRASYLPSLAAFAQHYYQAQRNEFDFVKDAGETFFKTGIIGLNLSVPIFDGFETRAQIRQADLELQQLRNSRISTEALLSKEVSDATRLYTTSCAAANRQKKTIEAAEEVYAVNLQGYRQSVVSLSDLLLSERSLIETRLSFINSLLQVKNAALEVKKAQSALLVLP